jgi:hypothetical protein
VAWRLWACGDGDALDRIGYGEKRMYLGDRDLVRGGSSARPTGVAECE